MIRFACLAQATFIGIDNISVSTPNLQVTTNGRENGGALSYPCALRCCGGYVRFPYQRSKLRRMDCRTVKYVEPWERPG